MKYTKRQVEIINAATELINKGGIQHFTTKALAERIGFTEPAIYRHFKNKTEIISSILVYFGLGLKIKLVEITECGSIGIDKLKGIIEFQFEEFAKNPAIVMVIFAETSFQYDDQLSLAFQNIMNNKKIRIEHLIKQGQEDRSIRVDIEAAQLASIFMGTMRFNILQWRLNGYKTDLQMEGKAFWNTIRKLFQPN